MSRRTTPREAFCLGTAVACGAVFFAIGYRALGIAHPAEDAYILFRYADHLAAGHGIVFNIGGPHAEGATDFLWLLLISGLVWIGIDVAIAALTLNALGASLAGWVLARVCWGDEQRSRWTRAALALALPSVILAGGSIAGYWGFSSMLYSALILLLFAVAIESHGRGVLLIPVIGVVIALFRPDGVVVGVPFVLLGLWKAWEERILSKYLAVAAACGVVGSSYAIWRWNYFGLPLPLPLYVKQNAPDGSGWGAIFPGLGNNLEWFFDPVGPHWIAAALVAVLVYVRFWRDTAARRLVLFMVPVALLLLALAFAVQTQNLEFRFQAPAHLVLLYALVAIAGRLADRGAALATLTALVVVVAAVTPSNLAGVRALDLHLSGTWRTYLETLAPALGASMTRQNVIALTEAGAVPYWTEAQVADIVGLNYPEAAVRPPTVADVRKLDPDVVFLHQGTSLANHILVPESERGGQVYVISPERLASALLPARRQVLERHPTSYDEIGLLNVQYAATVLIQYLSESPEYQIVVVDPSGRQSFLHVWGFKKDWAFREDALRAIEWSLDQANYRPYLDVRRLRSAQTPATNGAS